MRSHARRRTASHGPRPSPTTTIPALMHFAPALRRRGALLGAGVAVVMLCAGCGELAARSSDGPLRPLTVAIDGRPNALYAALYQAQALGDFTRGGARGDDHDTARRGLARRARAWQRGRRGRVGAAAAHRPRPRRAGRGDRCARRAPARRVRLARPSPRPRRLGARRPHGGERRDTAGRCAAGHRARRGRDRAHPACGACRRGRTSRAPWSTDTRSRRSGARGRSRWRRSSRHTARPRCSSSPMPASPPTAASCSSCVSRRRTTGGRCCGRSCSRSRAAPRRSPRTARRRRETLAQHRPAPRQRLRTLGARGAGAARAADRRLAAVRLPEPLRLARVRRLDAPARPAAQRERRRAGGHGRVPAGTGRIAPRRRIA